MRRERDKYKLRRSREEKVGSVGLTSQPDPRDSLMDVQKGALILFCQGLAVTQGPYCINKQEWRGKWQPPHLLSHGVIFSSSISTSTLLFI